MQDNSHLISVIIPIFNGSVWIKKCFDNILKQTAIGVLNLEICVCDDCSTDDTPQQLNDWKSTFENFNISFKVYRNEEFTKGGIKEAQLRIFISSFKKNIYFLVGCAKNKAVAISSGQFLCFQDIDDIMLPDRIMKQYEKALIESWDTVSNTVYDIQVVCENIQGFTVVMDILQSVCENVHRISLNFESLIIGCQFKREPENSTSRYTKWANSLSEEQLNLQVFTSHGPTVIMPTWFCHRKVYERVGGFFESKTGCPEDLVFFNKHLDLGGKVARVDEVLLVYTFHPSQTTFSIDEDTIWNLRIERLEKVVLIRWPKFTIWNAGKQGRKFYNSLSEENKEKVIAFCDVDLNKIGKKYSSFDGGDRKFGKEIDIIHFKHAAPPFIICIKIDLTEGVFEDNLRSLNLTEGQDYVMFS